ncbi:MAG: phage tail assembly protein [Opitutales bacterium]|nr:phage tail assembly protein [Opitutales bacterium]
MSEPITVKLSAPVTVKGTEIREVVLRRPKTRDLRKMMRGKGDEAERQFRMICDLAEMDPDTLDEFYASDYLALCAAIEPFLSPPTGSP